MSSSSDRRTVLTLGLAVAAGIFAGLIYFQTHPPDLATSAADDRASESGRNDEAGAALGEIGLGRRLSQPIEVAGPAKADLTVDADGLSRSVARLETGRGVIRFRCHTEAAPRTCQRISELIGARFYDGLVFHRVIPGFVIQAGDPTGTGSGGSGQLVPRELSALRHEAGAIGLAHENYDPNSGDSQFYVTLSPQPHLDGKYTVFGKVIEGLEVARKIERGDRIISLRWE